MEHPYLVLAIFLFTYAAIALQKIPGLHIDRPSGVVVGSTLLVLTGLIGLREAYGFVDGDVILFLLGIMIMVAYLGKAHHIWYPERFPYLVCSIASHPGTHIAQPNIRGIFNNQKGTWCA